MMLVTVEMRNLALQLDRKSGELTSDAIAREIICRH